jgi:hypothetical protein
MKNKNNILYKNNIILNLIKIQGDILFKNLLH